MPSQKQQEESIYNLIPKPQIIPPKPPQQFIFQSLILSIQPNKCLFRHESKFKEVVREEHKAKKQDHRTMGYAKEPVPKPNEFLKAHEKEFKPKEVDSTGK